MPDIHIDSDCTAHIKLRCSSKDGTCSSAAGYSWLRTTRLGCIKDHQNALLLTMLTEPRMAGFLSFWFGPMFFFLDINYQLLSMIYIYIYIYNKLNFDLIQIDYWLCNLPSHCVTSSLFPYSWMLVILGETSVWLCKAAVKLVRVAASWLPKALWLCQLAWRHVCWG